LFFFEGVRLALANADDPFKAAKFDEKSAKKLLKDLYKFVEWVKEILDIIDD